MISQSRYLLAVSLCIFSLCRTAVGQDAPASSTSGSASQVRLLQVTNVDEGTLENLPLREDIDGLSLDVSRASLEARPAAWQGLSAWVRIGGVVFLHTDAAQLFGYRTVPARTTTNRIAGQLYGRARAALPFGSHPLLWGTPSSATNNARTRQSAYTLGVRLVYYRMNAGDHLVTEHPAGVALLRVTDLTAAASANPLYAAAIAPFGRGWAVFTPSLVEQHRADGAAFVRNLLHLVQSASSARQATENAFMGIPARTIEQAATVAQGNDTQGFVTIAQQLNQTLASPLSLTNDAAMARDARLMLTRREVTGIITKLSNARNGERDRADAAALCLLLRARLELQRNEVANAAAWVRAARELRPDAADTLLWQGVLSAAQAEDNSLTSQNRAALLQTAADNWDDAVAASALLDAARATSATDGAAPRTAVSGLSRTTLRAWIQGARVAAALMNVEPPAVTVAGTEAAPVLLRYFPNDATLRLALPAATSVGRLATGFGSRVEDEEILIFPTVEYYAAYRRSAGAGGQNQNPAGGYGDVIGNRMLLVSQLSLPITLPPTTPGGQTRIVQFGAAVPAVVGRLHSYLLVNQIAGGGTPVPDWMMLGLASMGAINTMADLNAVNSDFATPLEALRRLALGGGLLTPQQFRGYASRIDESGLADAQAMRLMTFFYARYGAGRVIETLQRLGAGEGVDDALTATTVLSEAEFFKAWLNAEFPHR